MPYRDNALRLRAELLLDRVTSDPALLLRLRGAYRGRHELLDSLWWAAHPLTVSPRGNRDPAYELSELQRAVFARGPSGSPIVEADDPVTGTRIRMRESERRLLDKQRELDDDARELWLALDAIEPQAAAVAPRMDPEEVEISAEQPQQASSSGERPPKASDPSRSEKPKWAVAGALVAVLTGALLLPAIAQIPFADEPGASAPAETPAKEQSVLDASGQIAPPLTLLAESAIAGELPVASRLDDIPGLKAVRALPSLAQHLDLYVATGAAESVCLIAIYSDGDGTAECVPESRFAEDGIVFGPFSGNYPLGPDATRAVLSETLILAADGTFTFRSVVEDSSSD